MTTLTRESLSPSDLRDTARVINRSRSAKKAARNRKRAQARPEEHLQRCVVDYLALQERCGRLLYFHTPNGGSRNLLEAVKLKRLGTRKGIPDLCVIPKVGPVLFIELKSEDGRTTESQDYWLERLPDYGCPVRVCRSLEEVQQFLFQTGVIREG